MYILSGVKATYDGVVSGELIRSYYNSMKGGVVTKYENFKAGVVGRYDGLVNGVAGMNIIHYCRVDRLVMSRAVFPFR